MTFSISWLISLLRLTFLRLLKIHPCNIYEAVCPHTKYFRSYCYFQIASWFLSPGGYWYNFNCQLFPLPHVIFSLFNAYKTIVNTVWWIHPSCMSLPIPTTIHLYCHSGSLFHNNNILYLCLGFLDYETCTEQASRVEFISGHPRKVCVWWVKMWTADGSGAVTTRRQVICLLSII